MNVSITRTGAVVRKELTEFRRNRNIVATASVVPLVFLISPTASILSVGSQTLTGALQVKVETSLFIPLLVPVFVPALLSGYAVVGERDQGTLEPVLATPVTRAELVIGKATAIFLPAIVLAYLMFGVFVAITQLAASPAAAAAVRHAPQLPAALAFIPLLAAWAIWAGVGISARAADTRVAQQLAILGSLPPVAVAALMSLRVITPASWLVVTLGAGLLVIDCAACLVVARLFDTERLIAPTAATGRPGHLNREETGNARNAQA